MSITQTWSEFKALFPELADHARKITSTGNHTLKVESSRDIITERNGEQIQVTKTLLVIFSYESPTNWTLKTAN